MSESNTAVSRPLPLWPYTSSLNVNRARNSEPEKMSVNLCMQFLDYMWRFATVPPQEIALRLWQNIAHGGALALAINGTFDQQDRQALDAAQPVFRWSGEHEEFYAEQQSAARVILLGSPAGLGRSFDVNSLRGMFRLLSEEHIPFAVTDNVRWMGKRETDLVITTGWAPPNLLKYAESGGHVLLVTPEPPEFPLGRVVQRWPDLEGYFRVRNQKRFPSLSRTALMMTDGPYTEVEGDGADGITLVPPSMFGPPEFIHIDQQDTAKPGLRSFDVGKGRIVWIPWDAAGLYYRHSLPAHRGLLRDLVDSLLSDGRQLRTDAHPLVEMTLMEQGGRTLLHLINLSGHSQTAYFPPLTMREIRVDIRGSYSGAHSVRTPAQLKTEAAGSYTTFRLPELRDYEMVVLQ